MKTKFNKTSNGLEQKMNKPILKIAALILTCMLLSFTPKHIGVISVQKETSVSKKTSIKWKNAEINLGEIIQNKPVNIDFEFTNTGETPVLITSVQASCGCTSSNYSKTPILPGESTKITATFNAAAKGAFKKTVTVITNAEETPKTLIFIGTVI